MAQIAEQPHLLAEATVALPTLKAHATAPAGENGVRDVIGRRFVLFPQPDREPDEWQAWWKDYYDALEGLTLASLEAAMAAYVRLPDAEFMPKPGVLLALAKTTPARPIQAYERAEAAIRRAAIPPRPPAGDPISPPTLRQIHEPRESREQATAKWREVREGMGAHREPRPELPPIHGKTDESGITAEMRALMSRRED